jgi:regulator of cell morphogenesis and NO signaling
MNNIDKTKTLGQLVARYPYTVDVLNKYKIDYAFKGDVPLEKAIKKRGLTEYDVIGELELSVDEFKMMNDKEVMYWDNEPIGKILDFIEEKHHRFVLKTLKKTDFLLSKIEITGDLLISLTGLFRKLKEDMESHQAKEEENLFPLLRQYENNRAEELRNTIVRYMNETENEHDVAGDLFQKINDIYS